MDNSKQKAEPDSDTAADASSDEPRALDGTATEPAATVHKPAVGEEQAAKNRQGETPA